MKKVVIIDYQLGNLFSVHQACKFLGFDAVVSSKPSDLVNADYAILPGVGAFADAMQNLCDSGMQDAILKYVHSGKPLMGVCLGLQLLLSESEEFEKTKGLDIIPGRVVRFNSVDENNNLVKVPQIQWNQIFEPQAGKWINSPLQSCKSSDFMYFVHSYYAVPSNISDVLAVSEYGGTTYCSSLMRDNVFATQFHPEKSGAHGIQIYKDWFDKFKK